MEIFIDDIKIDIACRWTDTPNGCILKYILMIESDVFSDLSYNDIVIKITEIMALYPTTSMISDGCCLYHGQLYNALNTPEKRLLCATHAIICLRDMFTDSWLSRAERGDPALDALTDL